MYEIKNSKEVNLSIPAVNKRIARLRESGIIEKFTVQIDPRKIDKSVQAFIMLVVDQYSKVDELFAFIEKSRNIVSCMPKTLKSLRVFCLH